MRTHDSQPSHLAPWLAHPHHAGLRKLSLARRSGFLASASISTLICLAHWSFYYAQMFGQNERCGFTDSTGHYVNCVEPLERDGLLAAYASAHLDYDTSGALELALEGATTDLC